MGLFRPYDQAAKQPAAPAAEERTVGAPKNRPTPSRKQAQAARLEALHPKLTPRQARAADAAARAKREDMTIQARENTPVRVLMRNYIDARWSVTEFMVPLLLVMIAPVFLLNNYPMLSTVVTAVVWGAMLVAIGNIAWAWRGFRRELAQRYPHESTKGLLMMFISRMIMMRRMRQPAPAIKRGDTY